MPDELAEVHDFIRFWITTFEEEEQFKYKSGISR